MNRPRHYELEALRECVTNVFTAHGFRGTSINMLTDATGLGKQSLYNAIGDKEAAYVQALECAAQRMAGLQAEISRAPDGRRAVERFFNEVVGVCGGGDRGRSGCMLTAGLMEGIEAEAVAAKLREKWHGLCALLRDSVERGQHDGTIRGDVSSQALCNVLSTLFLGVRVAARVPTDREPLDETVRWVLKLLDKGSPLP